MEGVAALLLPGVLIVFILIILDLILAALQRGIDIIQDAVRRSR